ncbi:MAG: hypothetical protein LBC70_09060 [Chitinispirillales bacterium]|nr:hypothetical protein [Chitinispirillales bacterium]
MTRYFLLIASLSALLLLSAGCAARAVNVNAGADIGDEAESSVFEIAFGRIGILEPEMFLYSVSAGGIFEYRDDWSAAASRQVSMSAALALQRMGYDPLIIPSALPDRKREFFHLETRMRYHCTAFQSDFFTERKLAFGPDDIGIYSIGSVDSLCNRHRVDGFLYMYGFEEKFTWERQRFLSENATEASPVPRERTFMAAILVHRDGRILWYRHILVDSGLDMRSREHSLRMIEALFD